MCVCGGGGGGCKEVMGGGEQYTKDMQYTDVH